MPAMTAAGRREQLEVGRAGARSSLSGPRTMPLSERMIFQLMVRSRKLVKNGAMTRNSSRFL